MTQLQWNTATEWDAGQSDDGTVHQSVTNTDHTDASILKAGYDYSGFSHISPSPTLCYPFHEDSGSVANDLAGTNDATISGATVGTTGLLSTTAYDFDGTDDTVISDSSASLDNTTNGLSFTFWLNTDFDTSAPNGEYVFRWKAGGNNNTGFGFNAQSSNDIEFEWSDDRLSTNISTNHQNSWLFVALRADSDTSSVTLEIFLNASSITSGGVSGNQTVNGSAQFEIGTPSDQNGTHYDGQIYDFRWYNSRLTASQIQMLYDVVDTQNVHTSSVKTS